MSQSNEKLRLEDDGKDWINTTNLNAKKLNSFSEIKYINEKSVEIVDTACMTGDFAMQNVLMQIGLSVLSVDGKLVKQMKQWLLRCIGCYQIHYDMTKLFCSKCGLGSLTKISAHIDSETGILKLHLKKNYQVNTRGNFKSFIRLFVDFTRNLSFTSDNLTILLSIQLNISLGTKYSISKPKTAGVQARFEGDLLLREDQLLSGIWRQKSVNIKKNISSAFGEDITGDVGIHLNKGSKLMVGYGKQNPNAMKGRERRGKGK